LAVAEEHGVRFAEVVAANGAGRSALLRQTLADALGVPVTWSSDGGGTLNGAAILAGLGAGVLESARAASVGAWRPKATARHEPEPRAQARLRGVFERRLALYDAVRSATPELARG
jgi:xylulokinase